MSKYLGWVVLPVLLYCGSCKTGAKVYNAQRKYPPEKLKQDYTLFRHILEDGHPSLYWYTTKDSLDHFFEWGMQRLNDSLTEPEFKLVLDYVISRIYCGHTAVKYSRNYSHYLDSARNRSFPLAVKCWGDTMVVTSNLNSKDSILKRGCVIRSINGFTQKQLFDSLFNFVVTDGYSNIGKYQTISTGFTFAHLYNNSFGISKPYDIEYIDSLGAIRHLLRQPYDFRADTLGKKMRQEWHSKRKPEKHPAFFNSRDLKLDLASATATMTVNTFGGGNRLRSFFRRSFRTLKKDHIKNLIIDVRSNGGGDANLSTLFTRYLINKPFKLADSLYALNRGGKYQKYIEKGLFYHLLMDFITSKRNDGKYHFGYFERHYYHPEKHNHFNGDVYVMIGGNSFSATTLFAGALKGQKNITLVGEETGGSFYGNTAWIIPDVVLPNTHLRFRLPKFRLVIDRNRIKDGRGVMPDVWVSPTVEAIRLGRDFKTDKVKELIASKNHSNQ